MPYILKSRRQSLDERVVPPTDAGELNYCITRLCLEYLEGTVKKYHNYNEVMGALESAKLEFYRRAVASYEDKKISENGDVY